MQERSITVRTRPDAETARRAARQFAREEGFDNFAVEEFTLAVMELATNLVRHATDGGSITLRTQESSGRRAVEVVSADQGPGIQDVSRAIAGGHSTAGGLGSGLSVVHRLLDHVEISTSNKGTVVIGRKWLDG